MSALRMLAFILGAIAAAKTAACVASDRGLGGAIRSGGFSARDAMLWVFGLIFLGAGVWRIVSGGGLASGRALVWLAIGAIVLYGEVFNAKSAKEFSCYALLQGRGVRHAGPC